MAVKEVIEHVDKKAPTFPQISPAHWLLVCHWLSYPEVGLGKSCLDPKSASYYWIFVNLCTDYAWMLFHDFDGLQSLTFTVWKSMLCSEYTAHTTRKCVCGQQQTPDLLPLFTAYTLCCPPAPISVLHYIIINKYSLYQRVWMPEDCVLKYIWNINKAANDHM